MPPGLDPGSNADDIGRGLTEAAPEIRVVGISKTFPGTLALDDVSMTIGRGEVHALVGQNGSGKSTLIKILCGFHEPDPGGEIYVDGAPIENDRSAAAHRLGLRFVHQGLGLIDELNAIDNIALAGGYVRGKGGRVAWRDQVRRTRELLARVGVSLDIWSPVGERSAVERTAIAIARALAGVQPGRGTLILDEPSVALSSSETESLFVIVRDLAASGVSVLYVSHYLEEVFAIADRVTILRNGRVVATRLANELTKRTLIRLMVGAELEAAPPATRVETEHGSVPVLTVEGLTGRELRGVSFELGHGEILGVAGALGSGRTELPLILVGAAPFTAGSVAVGGRAAGRHTPAGMKDLGIVLVPADRHRQGSVAEFTVRENMTLADTRAFRRGARIDRRAERRFVERWIADLDVRPPRSESAFSSLSGGNQQKVVIGKWLGVDPKILLLDEPSAGVDVSARANIHRLIRARAAAGLSVVVCSADTAEIAELATRVIVLRDGQVAAELVGEAITEEEILHAMEGGSRRVAAASGG